MPELAAGERRHVAAKTWRRFAWPCCPKKQAQRCTGVRCGTAPHRGPYAFPALGLAVLWLGACGAFKPVPLLEGDPDVLPPGIIQEHECTDFWSVVHLGSGYLLGRTLGDESFLESFLALTAYEILEPQFWPYWGENQINQECDIAAGALGWLWWYLAEG